MVGNKDRYKLAFHQEAKKEYDNLDSSQRILVDKSFKRIKEIGMDAGKPLHGKLHFCRKLKHRKAGLRVIFRQSEHTIEIIEILAIGKRENLNVYQKSENRL